MRSIPPLADHSRRGGRGGRRAADELLPLVYDRLRALAARHLRAEPPGHTLQATALVHEAYLQLAGDAGRFGDRAHFFAVAARVVRRLLVQYARRKHGHRRGRGWIRVDLDVDGLAADGDGAPVLAVDEALRRLAELDPEKARLVELRFFAGLSAAEAAGALQMSPRTAAREWALARAFLSRELRDGAPR